MRDTQLIETTQELNRHIVNLLDSLSALYGLTDISIRNLDENKLLRQALEALMSNQDMERCSIFLLDEANLLTVAAGLDWNEMLRNITRSDEANPRQTHKDKPRRKIQFRLGEGILGRAAESGNIQHCRSCADDPQFKKIDVDGEPVQGSLLCVPITCEEQVIGVVNVYYPEPDFFNMWHERLLLLFCKMLGRLLISHRFVSQLDKLVDQQTQDLTKMNSSLRDEKELLKKSAVSLRAILDNSPYLVWLKDTEGRYLKVNKAYADYARLKDIRQVIGKTDFDLYPKELAEKFRIDDAEVMASRQQKHIEELSLEGSKEVWVATFKTPVIDESGNVLGTTGFAQDVTERKQNEEKIRISEARLQATLDNSPYMIWQKDPEGRYLAVNEVFLKMTGQKRMQDVLGKTDFDLWPKELAEKYHADDAEVMLSRRHIVIEERAVNNGQTYWVETCKTPIVDTYGKVLGTTGFAQDITARKAAEEQIKHLAHHDTLTNLPNRTLFNDRLQQALAIAKRDKAHMALMFIDLDEFKPINDTYGHAVGDLLLKEVAVRIQDCLRESDTVARMGGDEFTVLLPTIDAKQDASIVAEKIRHALNQPFELASNSLLISSSIGIAIYPEHGSDEKSLLKNADTAMYYAKESGRNTVKIFPTE